MKRSKIFTHNGLGFTMKINFVFYDIYQNAGIQKALIYWIGIFLKKGFRVTLVCGCDLSLKVLSHENLKIIPLFQSFPSEHTRQRAILFAFKARSVIRDLDGPVIDFGTWTWILTARIILYKHFGLKGNQRLKKMLTYLKVFKKNLKLIVLTEEIKQDFHSLGYENVAVLPNYIEEWDYHVLNQIYSNRSRTPSNWVLAGRNSTQKGFDLALQTFNDSENENLIFYVPNLVIKAPRVKTLGRFGSHEEVFCHEALLMPSRYEGLPFLAIESIIAGCPVFHSGANGFKDIFSSYFEFFYVNYHSSSWSKNVRSALNDPNFEEIFSNLREQVVRSYVLTTDSAYKNFHRVLIQHES